MIKTIPAIKVQKKNANIHETQADGNIAHNRNSIILQCSYNRRKNPFFLNVYSQMSSD